ncbi:hypothetical protein GCM10007907_20710 [Chitinimonas prasina]|uniref:RcnB family protein n=2 Tax=Chitinimonas prasina TaxID=1434937 RepID=A0ABQ5YE82_9NEIS|nr:hypothetical protein GCM10007907_20710 [Chitinimonas prasina]
MKVTTIAVALAVTCGLAQANEAQTQVPAIQAAQLPMLPMASGLPTGHGPAETGTPPVVGAINGPMQPKAWGEIRILGPSTSWVYTPYYAQLTVSDLWSIGWTSSFGWQALRDPSGNVWLARTSGLYIDYAIPLPRLY